METRQCVQCGKSFTLTDEEIQFYESKNLTLPKRCKACREGNKEKKSGKHKTEEIQQNARPQMPSSSGGKRSKKRTLTLVVLVIVSLVYFFSRIFQWGGNSSEASTVTDLPTVSSDSSEAVQEIAEEPTEDVAENTANAVSYTFRSEKLLNQHFQKHGGDFDYETAEEYQAGASAVINSPDALHKTEQEDGDDVYYIEATNEFVILSTDGYIRTYFKPDAGLSYYERQ